MLTNDGIYVSFPQDGINIAGIKTKSVGGHGAVIAVDESTGNTRGSSYGRNVQGSGSHGQANRIYVPSFHPQEPGNPTKEELDKYAKKLNKKFPQWGNKVNVTYVKGASYDDMVKYMEESEKANKGFSKAPYNLYNHNCGVYGVETINQAMPWYRQVSGRLINLVPGIFNSILGGIAGIGHDIEQKSLGTNTWQGFTNFTGAGGKANAHGWSLPWSTTFGTYTKEK